LKSFCCNGCKTVYEIFSLNDLTCYYDFQSAPGATPQDIQGKYDFLDNESIVQNFLEFQENTTHIISLTFLIFIVVRVFGFWKIYSVFNQE
jgi:Cu+-exporting ATPase